jgi:hypothetical protein
MTEAKNLILAVTRTPRMDKRQRANGPNVRSCPDVTDAQFVGGAEILEAGKKGAAREGEREGDDTVTVAKLTQRQGE